MHDNTVDTSVAGFFWTFQRSEAVDFTQGLFPGTIAAIIRRPTKLDVSFRYFYLEFTSLFIKCFGFSLIEYLLSSFLTRNL